MLRVLLRYESGSDDLFVEILRDFLRTHAGGVASTEDFLFVVEKHTSGDWDWFFDQWIYRAEMPSLRWSYEVSPAPEQRGRYSLDVRVEREGMEDDFFIPIPLHIELEGGEVLDRMLDIAKDVETFHYQFEIPVKDVELDPDRSFLVKVREE